MFPYIMFLDKYHDSERLILTWNLQLSIMRNALIYLIIIIASLH